jgi:hypothetical protein
MPIHGADEHDTYRIPYPSAVTVQPPPFAHSDSPPISATSLNLGCRVLSIAAGTAILLDSFDFNHILRSLPHNAILTQLHMHCMLNFHQITHANSQSHSLAPSSRRLLQFRNRMKRRGDTPPRNHAVVPQAHPHSACPSRYIAHHLRSA